jgi:allantoate deiminase
MTSLERAREAVERCRALARCSESRGAITRPSFSGAMRQAHRELGQWMRAAGLIVSVDAGGNLRGFRPASSGSGAALPPLFIGSHLDTVPNAGAFDGVLGVVLGLALVEALGPRGLPFGVEIIGFSDEEGSRFGVPFIGSKAFAGAFDRAFFDCPDDSGFTVWAAMSEFGLDPDRVGDAAAPAGALGYLEFHIEQGPELERVNLPLGIVDAVAGQTRAEVVFTGVAGHAGTTPMAARRDALAGGAEWIGRVEQEALSTAGLVATVGRIDAEPGAANVIPERCRMALDVRHVDDRTRRAAVERLESAARDVAGRRGLTCAWTSRLEHQTVPMDGGLTGRLERAVARAGFAPHRMASGAGHDAAVVASRMPAAMLFVRCERGISHHPDESVREDDVAAALDVGLSFVDDLDKSPDDSVS